MLITLSQSELYFIQDKPEDFNDLLFQVGFDTTKPVQVQENIQHRNRFNNVVTCNRWIGTERLDKEWINSGYASREARLKASGSKLACESNKELNSI